jgi:hypothetical protein
MLKIVDDLIKIALGRIWFHGGHFKHPSPVLKYQWEIYSIKL